MTISDAQSQCLSFHFLGSMHISTSIMKIEECGINHGGGTPMNFSLIGQAWLSAEIHTVSISGEEHCSCTVVQRWLNSLEAGG